MNTIAKIKAEIERLKSIEYPCDNSQQATGFFNALALTCEDVRRIVIISEDVFEEGNNLSEQEFYEEMLTRFKQIKEAKNE